jgi:hypothetical protein
MEREDMSETTTDATDMPMSAEQLRMQILEKELEKAAQAEKAAKSEHEKLAAFTQDFLTSHVSAEETAMVRRLVFNAVKDGKMEALVYSFPSLLCTDQGRAINSNAPGWPETLQGKAKEFYDRFETLAKPQGYRLKAMIINFPGGVPGDVGFFLNWAPQEA